jgi:hypothetical protein
MQGLPLYTTTGGVLAALVIFKQNTIWQLTGDIATSNLQINQLSGSIGTQAPRSVASSPYGIYFMAADGVRNITLAGAVSEPDNNIALPFINALYPSRVAGTYSADIYRLCVQNSIVAGTPFQDYYYHAKYDEWSGPHTFRVDHAIVYLNDFLVVNNSASASIWQSFSAQGRNSTGNTFIENGVQLTWSFISSPMTDLKNLYANCAVRTTLDIDQPATGDIFTFQAIDAFNGVLATAFIRMGTNLAIWGTFNWGASLWGAVQSGLSPITIPWSNPIIFDKLIFCASGNSSLTLRLGSIFVGYERLRYSKQ